MQSRKIISFLLVLAAALSLAACGAENAPPTEDAVTLTDMVGREVALTPGGYRRIVCIGAGALRMYCYVGDVSLLCGVEDIDNLTLTERPKMFDAVARPYVLANEELFAALPSCGVGGPNAQTAEAERILACEPDLVLSEYGEVEKADALQAQLGVPVVVLRTGQDGVFDPLFLQSVSLLGQVLGREAEAGALAAFIEKECAELSSRTENISAQPAVYIGGLGNWGTADHLMTSPDYAAFDRLHIRNAAAALGGKGIQPIEAEAFVALGEDIDILFLDAAAVKNIAPLLAEDAALFDACKAWRTGEVYLQMAYNAYYTNMEIALINAWFIGKTVYPDAFADIDITAKTNEITEAFLGEPLAEKIFACPASFGGYQRIDTQTFFG